MDPLYRRLGDLIGGHVQAVEQQIVQHLTQLMQSIGWPGVVLIMALESANIPIPSELTMPLAGWLLVQARGGTALQAIWQGGLYGAVGCTIGSVASYWLGAWGGRPLLERYGRYLFLRQRDLEQAERWFARWGDWAAFVSRLLPIVRTFISFPAGVARMRFGTFTVYSFVGSYIWCAGLAWGGYVFAHDWAARDHAAVRSAHCPGDRRRRRVVRPPTQGVDPGSIGSGP